MAPASANMRSPCSCRCGEDVTAKTARGYHGGKAPVLLQAAAAAIHKRLRRPQNPFPGPAASVPCAQVSQTRRELPPTCTAVTVEWDGDNQHPPEDPFTGA